MQITHDSKPVVFIADIHLSASRPDITTAFHQLLNQLTDIDALYIMGDLFEVWLGADILPQEMQATIAKIKQASAKFPIYFCCGNRDFLIQANCAEKLGMTWLEDIQSIDLFGTKTLIMHGDTLCTADTSYQKYRKFVHQSWAQTIFGKLPQSIRMFIYNKIRNKSKQEKTNKQADIMDVTPAAVNKTLQTNQATRIIHGHTHRPALHKINLNHQRWVVGDWYEQSSLLVVTSKTHQLLQIPFNQINQLNM